MKIVNRFCVFRLQKLNILNIHMRTALQKLKNFIHLTECKTPRTDEVPGVLFMPSWLVVAHHSYPQFLHLNCLPGFLLANPQMATSINFAFFNRGEVYMKIEIDTKELATLINVIREQRESVCNADSLAKEIKESLPQKISERLNLHT